MGANSRSIRKSDYEILYGKSACMGRIPVEIFPNALTA